MFIYFSELKEVFKASGEARGWGFVSISTIKYVYAFASLFLFKKWNTSTKHASLLLQLKLTQPELARSRLCHIVVLVPSQGEIKTVFCWILAMYQFCGDLERSK